MQPYRSRPYIETINTNVNHQIEGNQVEETCFLTPSQAAAHPLESVKETHIVLSESAATVGSTTLRTSGAAGSVIKSNDEDVQASAELKGLALSHEPKVQAALREKFSFVEMVDPTPDIASVIENVNVLLAEMSRSFKWCNSTMVIEYKKKLQGYLYNLLNSNDSSQRATSFNCLVKLVEESEGYIHATHGVTIR